MNPTPIGYLAIFLGILIALEGGLAGGNILIIGLGLIAIALGGSTKKTKTHLVRRVPLEPEVLPLIDTLIAEARRRLSSKPRVAALAGDLFARVGLEDLEQYSAADLAAFQATERKPGWPKGKPRRPKSAAD
jgi:hypothetical protein